MATNGSASAQQNWDFQVIGGSAGDLVPLRITTVLETSGSGAGGPRPGPDDGVPRVELDPDRSLIRVDPSFANAATYSIVLSDGVGNAIPEPGTLPLVVGAVTALAWRSGRTPSSSRS